MENDISFMRANKYLRAIKIPETLQIIFYIALIPAAIIAIGCVIELDASLSDAATFYLIVGGLAFAYLFAKTWMYQVRGNEYKEATKRQQIEHYAIVVAASAAIFFISGKQRVFAPYLLPALLIGIYHGSKARKREPTLCDTYHQSTQGDKIDMVLRNWDELEQILSEYATHRKP